MSFFGLFKKTPKNPFEDIKQTWTEFKNLLERSSLDKPNDQSKQIKNLAEFQKKMERICIFSQLNSRDYNNRG
jgi:hypothetical protein